MVEQRYRSFFHIALHSGIQRTLQFLHGKIKVLLKEFVQKKFWAELQTVLLRQSRIGFSMKAGHEICWRRKVLEGNDITQP